MGAYFLTSNPDALDRAIDRMARKGLGRYVALDTDGVTLLAFHKRFVDNDDHILQRDSDFIAGFGAWSYGSRFGNAALPAIWGDLVKGCEVWPAVRGHFTFVVRLGGALTLVTDKCGIYHGFAGRADGHFYASSSLFAVAEALPSLSIGAQECMEYLYTQATYGGATVFNEVRHLEPGAIYDLRGFEKRTNYYFPARQRVSVDEYLTAADDWFAGCGDASLKWSCDMSGGYDSRTVGTLMEHAGCRFGYNTNTNPKDPRDHAVAVEVAGAVARPIELFDRGEEDLSFPQQVERCFVQLEICRDVFAAMETPSFFARKAASFDVVAGGYGGELLRDKYSRFSSVRGLVETAYFNAGAHLPPGLKDRYLNALEAKFNARLAEWRPPDMKTGVEMIYYLEKMRFWGGSRITAFNQFCYRLHPLLDDLLAKYSFGFTLDEKRDAAIQRRIMTAACPAMAQVRSSYFDQPLDWREGPPPGGLQKLKMRLKKWKYAADGWLIAAKNASFISPSRSSSFVSAFAPAGYLAGLLGIRFRDVYNLKMQGRYLTLEKTFDHFRDRISPR